MVTDRRRAGQLTRRGSGRAGPAQQTGLPDFREQIMLVCDICMIFFSSRLQMRSEEDAGIPELNGIEKCSRCFSDVKVFAVICSILYRAEGNK